MLIMCEPSSSEKRQHNDKMRPLCFFSFRRGALFKSQYIDSHSDTCYNEMSRSEFLNRIKGSLESQT